MPEHRDISTIPPYNEAYPENKHFADFVDAIRNTAGLLTNTLLQLEHIMESLHDHPAFSDADAISFNDECEPLWPVVRKIVTGVPAIRRKVDGTHNVKSTAPATEIIDAMSDSLEGANRDLSDAYEQVKAESAGMVEEQRIDIRIMLIRLRVELNCLQEQAVEIWKLLE